MLGGEVCAVGRRALVHKAACIPWPIGGLCLAVARAAQEVLASLATRRSKRVACLPEVLADPVASSPLGARDAASAAWALAQASVARADLVEAVRGGAEAGGVGAQCREGVGCFRAF